MKYKALLFDCDNTLLDFDKAEREALIPTLKFMGIKVNKKNEELYSQINMIYWEKFERKEITQNEVVIQRWEHFASLFHIEIDGPKVNEYYASFLKMGGYPLKNSFKVLEELRKRGYKICLVSNGHPMIQHSRIKVSKIDNYLDKIYISQEIGFNKPDPKYFDYVLSDLNLSKKDVVVIGDSLTSDMQGAVNASLDHVLVDLKKKHPDYEGLRITSLKELLKFFD